MTPTDRNSMLTVWRRRLFVFWISIAAFVALFAIIGGPLLSGYHFIDIEWVALLSPLAMALFLASGLGWLALLMASKRRQP